MEILLSFREGAVTIPMTYLPAVSWGPDLSWALAALPIKIAVIIKVNVTGMRTASQVTQQNPSNCQRLWGKHNCPMQCCLSWLLQCCPSAPAMLSSLAACLHHPCWGARLRAALSPSLSICGYMCCPFPNHTFVLRLLFPFFQFLFSFFPLWCVPVSPCSWACQAAFLSIPGGFSPHCQLLQFQTQLFSSVLRQMESLITFYRLGRVQNAIDSQCLSFTAASTVQTLVLHSVQHEGPQH